MDLTKALLSAAFFLAVIGIPAQAATYTCSSCLTCSQYLQNGSMSSADVLQVTTTISSTGTCISFGGADNLILDCLGNTIDGDDSGTTDYGIWLNQTGDGSNYNTIRNCVVTDFYHGIFLMASNYNSLVNNLVSSANRTGIRLYQSDYNNLTSNTGWDNGGSTADWDNDAIYLQYSNSSILSGNNASYNYQHGIAIVYSKDDIIDSSYANNNSKGYGIQVSTSNNTKLKNNIAYLNNQTGIYIFNVNYANLTNNSVWSNGQGLSSSHAGIYLSGSNYSVLSRNNASYNNYAGIFYTNSYNGIIELSYTSSNLRHGMRVYNSNNTKVLDNIAYNNNWAGIYSQYSNYTNFTNNIAWSNGFSAWPYSGMVVESSSYSLLNGNNASYNYMYGILNYLSHNNTVTINKAHNNNRAGIYLASSDNSTVTNNTAWSNGDGYNWPYCGIFLSYSNYSQMSGNNASYNNYIGIHMDASMNNVFDNEKVSNNIQRGFLIRYFSQYNTIRDSIIEKNANYGIYLEANVSTNSYPAFNTFYNNYLNNTINIFSNSVNNQNWWNTTPTCTKTNIMGGPCIAGNFWTDPDGNFSDTCADSEPNGICDSEYSPAENNTDHAALSLSWGSGDTTPPSISFVSPTPPNSTNASGTYIEVNASISEPPASCILDWRSPAASSNHTMYISGLYCYFNETSLSNGIYSFLVYASDSHGNMNSSELRQAGVYYMPPIQLQATHSINPKALKTSTNTTISLTISNLTNLSQVRLSITMPNATVQNFTFPGNMSMNYTPLIQGLYNLSIFVNDTAGNNLSLSDTFTASDTFVNFTCNVTTYNSTGIPSKIELYYPGSSSKIAEFQSETGNFTNKETLEQNYDFLFKAYNERIQVILRNINISQNLNREMGFDNPLVAGYNITYAVSNTYPISSATVRINYSGQAGLNEDHIGVYKCVYWNFTERACSSTWDAQAYSQDKANDYVYFDVASFSAFSLRQETFCGDGICQAGESASTCNSDCDCSEGEEMDCGVGECIGVLTCQSGSWATCNGPSPQTEICNRKDDNCDGIVDNLNNGTSISSSQCQCYGNQAPLATETCNGIDDDCDGVIDDNANCCANGETRQCGINVGMCAYGTSTCAAGVWGSCIGGISPDPSETCGNGIDDDCNGQADESCQSCSDSDSDGYGNPASNACRHPELDCNDSDSSINPGFAEVCDQKDNNCNGETDEGLSCSACSNGKQDAGEEGVDCGGECPSCPFYTSIWFYISATGAVVLGMLLFFYFKLRKHGKELTWEELMKRWTPSNG